MPEEILRPDEDTVVVTPAPVPPTPVTYSLEELRTQIAEQTAEVERLTARLNSVIQRQATERELLGEDVAKGQAKLEELQALLIKFEAVPVQE